MPIIEHSTYKAPLLYQNGHIQTIYPTLIRSVKEIKYQRERIETPDYDFLDLDWSKVCSDNLVFLIHGLTSSSKAGYMRAMVRAFNKRGWDSVVLNLRGCSGEPNKLYQSYHTGVTEDVHTALHYVQKNYSYRNIALVGFSLGGNLILKYVGEQGLDMSPIISKAVAISVPCDISTCIKQMERFSSWIYARRFVQELQKKLHAKSELFPDKIKFEDIRSLKTMRDVDDYYTAKAHGFSCVEDYWEFCSSKRYLPNIRIPTLLINAQNDPFLSKECYPIDEAKNSEWFFLEMPKSGGHCGFLSFNSNGEYWHEKRTASFIME